VLLASEDMITQRIDAHLARAKRATVIVGKHLGDGAPKLLQKKACQTSSGKRVTHFCLESSDRKPKGFQLRDRKVYYETTTNRGKR